MSKKVSNLLLFSRNGVELISCKSRQISFGQVACLVSARARVPMQAATQFFLFSFFCLPRSTLSTSKSSPCISPLAWSNVYAGWPLDLSHWSCDLLLDGLRVLVKRESVTLSSVTVCLLVRSLQQSNGADCSHPPLTHTHTHTHATHNHTHTHLLRRLSGGRTLFHSYFHDVMKKAVKKWGFQQKKSSLCWLKNTYSSPSSLQESTHTASERLAVGSDHAAGSFTFNNRQNGRDQINKKWTVRFDFAAAYLAALV